VQGTGEIKATYANSKHFMTCSTYQICIMLLFNEHDTLTFTDIQTATGIAAPDLRRNLWTLIVQSSKVRFFCFFFLFRYGAFISLSLSPFLSL
jgi:cullin 3